MIHLTAKELATVSSILHDTLAGLQNQPDIIVFGSRVTGKHHEFSDLDIVLRGNEKIPLHLMSELDEKFSESNLAFKVDLNDWLRITPEFQKHIANYGVPMPTHI